MANNYWNLSIEGVGPFKDAINANLDFSSSRAVLYAANGQGKTSLSRMFRIAEIGQEAYSDTYVHKDKKTGKFIFDINGKNKLEVELTRGVGSTVSNSTGYKFHVFNSDYVADNLARNHFIPSGEIQGYIVGKAEIDLASERAKLAEIEKVGKEQKSEIEAAIEAQKEALKEFGITNRLAEFKTIELEAIMSAPIVEYHYSKKENQYRVLNNIQDDAPPIEKIVFRDSNLSLEEIANILATRYSKAQFSADFLEAIRNKTRFIEAGMSIQDGITCPFCDRKYDQFSSELISEYDKYLKDEEVTVIKSIDAHIAAIDMMETQITSLVRSVAFAQSQFDLRKQAFDDVSNRIFPSLVDIEETKISLTSIKNTLEQKKTDITKSIDQIDISFLAEQLRELRATVESCNELIDITNSKQTKASVQKTVIRKVLCTEAAKKIRGDEDEIIRSLNDSRAKYRALSEVIKKKEAQGKRNKKEAVGELLTELISQVFGGKYKFDADTFNLILGDVSLKSDADKVLSDGERTVVAFCHYVASTYVLLERDDEAKDLFFVIDDPISSLDYNYVYAISQIIREFHILFKIRQPRFLVLTHNEAFFNLMMRNKIAKHAFLLTQEGISACPNEIIAPYAGHLNDIYGVSQGRKPTHTTGNSARQVLEALWHFEDPSIQNLHDYLSLDKCGDLSTCPSLYTLISDQSHGATVFERGQILDEEQARRACAVIISHIQNYYPGQLKSLGIGWPSPGENEYS